MTSDRSAKDPSEHGRPVTIDVRTPDVCVPIPQGGFVSVDLRHRREDVVRRLLGLGVSSCTLMTLLPEWEGLIVYVAGQAHDG